jgi:signal transduction histidine kinase
VKRPLSLYARLLLTAMLIIPLTLLVTGWMIHEAVSGVIVTNVNDKMDGQVQLLELAINPDGKLELGRAQFVPDFTQPQFRWGWRVTTRAGTWHGGEPLGPSQPDTNNSQLKNGIVNALAMSAESKAMHVRTRASGMSTIEVAAPASIIENSISAATRPTLIALVVLGLASIAAAILQLYVALKPLRAFEVSVARLRSGEAASVSARQPRELEPLANELNALMEQNVAGLHHARTHVANLAHGLKTPLATLALGLAREQASPKLRNIVADLDHRIDHHLGRARAAAVSVGERARTPVGEVIRTLARTMRSLYEERAISLRSKVADGVEARVDKQDLDEMIGNLLDNACRHARSRVIVGANREGSRVRITIEDDGPGIADDSLDTAIQTGTRLDETGRGYGFGLGIARELAALYGGSLNLDRSPNLNGLRATLSLPGAVEA